jgi:hypothetical protein
MEEFYFEISVTNLNKINDGKNDYDMYLECKLDDKM